MTTIDSAQRLAGILRQQVSSLRPKPGRSTAAARARDAPAPDAAAVAAQRIQAIAADDPRRKQKAVRIFLESVLLHELGNGLVQDADFHSMVDAVQEQLQADARLAAAVDELAEILVKG